jgi:hypothetical protein
MATRILGPTRSRRRRRFLLAPIFLVAVVGLFWIAGAQAVHDNGFFQLDRNAYQAIQSTIPATEDWDNVCPAATPAGIGGCIGNTTADAHTFDIDPADAGPLGSAFTTGGSKDTNDITSWQHTSTPVPDKDNLLHGYAAREGDLLFFGADREAVQGTASLGVWFLQANVGPLAGGTFSGSHQDGDLLVIADFQATGANSAVRVFEWQGTGAAGSLVLIAGEESTPADCVAPPHPADSEFCATSNLVNANSPWAFQSKSGPPNIFLPGLFFEGGIDLGALDLEEGCFSTFLAETRSSNSPGSQLKDFVTGQLESCETTVVTTPSAGSNGEVSIGTGSVSVTDSAEINVTNASTFGGTVTFFLCGPTPLSDADYTLCTSPGGTQIGTPQPVTGEGGTDTVVSPSAALTSAGRYCWRADYSGDPAIGVPSGSDSSVGECFRVTPVTPTLTTNATGPVTIGNPISDTATLGGTANQPGTPVINPTTAGGPAGGSITFTAYGPNDATCANAPAFTSAAIPVSGNGTYNSGNFTPTAAGTYLWVATYTGNSPNTNPASTACGDAGETSVVNPRTPTIVTNATAGPVPLGSPISDTATIGNTQPQPDGDPANGTVTFFAYGPNDATCANAPAFTSAAIPVSGNGTYNSGDFMPTVVGTYRWIATYTGDPPNTSGPVSTACNDPNESSVVIQLQPAISTAQTFVLHDEATITVASSGAGNLAGTVRFRLFNNATCDPANGGLLYDSNDSHPSGIPVSGSGSFPQSVTVSSDNVTITTSKPVLSWLVEYTSTNQGHNNVTSACNTENASLTINNGS